MANHVDLAAGQCGQSFDDHRHVVELALDAVAAAVAARPTATTIDGMDGEMHPEQWPHRPERGVVGGRAVDDEEGPSAARREDSDERSVPRLDEPRSATDDRQPRAPARSLSFAAAASSTNHVASARRASWAGTTPGSTRSPKTAASASAFAAPLATTTSERATLRTAGLSVTRVMCGSTCVGAGTG